MPSAAAAGQHLLSPGAARPAANVLVDCGASSMVAIRKWQVDPNPSRRCSSAISRRPFRRAAVSFLLDAQLVSRRTAPLVLAGPPGFGSAGHRHEAMFAARQVERRFALEVRELAPARAPVELCGLAVRPT